MICRYTYSSTGLDQGLRRVVLAAVATTEAKPHVQKQLAHELEVGRSVMGERRRPHSLGERCSKAIRSRNVDGWVSCVLLYSNKAE